MSSGKVSGPSERKRESERPFCYAAIDGFANDFEIDMKISKVVIIINQTKGHAKQTAAALKAVLDRERVQQEWIETLPPQRHLYRRLDDLRDLKADLVIACGGGGTELPGAPRFSVGGNS